MFQRLYPKREEKSAYAIDYEEFYRQGYRGILFDVDNTLVEHNAPANEEAKALFLRLKKMGFVTCIISNNERERVEPFADALRTAYIFKAGKPAKDGYLAGMEKIGTAPENTFFVGDQIFTDIWGANRAGVYSVLVGQVASHETIFIFFKRLAERIVLFGYHRQR